MATWEHDGSADERGHSWFILILDNVNQEYTGAENQLSEMTVHRRRWIRFVPVLCIAAARGDGAPTPAPTAPAPPTLQSLSISPLPSVLQIGQQVTLTAIVALTDGAQKQALNVAWESSDPAVATVSSTGVLTVTGYGEAQVRASAYGQSATARVFAPPPPKIKLAVKIDPHGSTAGMCDVTRITFDMSGSSGTGLRYSISYGDGASDSEVIDRHAFACPASQTSPRILSVHATVTDALDRTDSATATVTVVDRLDRMEPFTYPRANNYLSVIFSGDSIASEGPEYRQLTFLHQSALVVTGTYSSSGPSDHRPFTATLNADNDLDVRLDDGTIHMSGHLVLTPGATPVSTRIVLTVTGGSANGKTLAYVPYFY